jgi:cyclophilin family peptidyl-prolyl cis-trans isomerase
VQQSASGSTGRARAGRLLAVVALIVAAVALVACGSNNKNNKSGNASGTPAANGSPGPSTAGRTFAKAPAFSLDPTKGYVADIKTDKGDIIVTLNAKAAPLTVNNFVFLAQQHFYDGLHFCRVIAGFVAQACGPDGTTATGPGYTIPDEPNPLTHDADVIAMANTGQPNSAGSQFYITLAPQHQLDGKYTVFGAVTQGQDVVQKIAVHDPAGSSGPGDEIISITISTTNTPATIPAGSPAPAAASPAPRATP